MLLTNHILQLGRAHTICQGAHSLRLWGGVWIRLKEITHGQSLAFAGAEENPPCVVAQKENPPRLARGVFKTIRKRGVLIQQPLLLQ